MSSAGGGAMVRPNPHRAAARTSGAASRPFTPPTPSGEVLPLRCQSRGLVPRAGMRGGALDVFLESCGHSFERLVAVITTTCLRPKRA